MENGKKMITVVGAYMILKGILNLILGFSASNLVSLLFAAVLIFAMLKRIPYSQYVTVILSGGRLAGCRCSCHFGIP